VTERTASLQKDFNAIQWANHLARAAQIARKAEVLAVEVVASIRSRGGPMLTNFLEWSQRQATNVRPLAMQATTSLLENANGAAEWAMSQASMGDVAASCAATLEGVRPSLVAAQSSVASAVEPLLERLRNVNLF
jgi:hypothetical protein